MTLAGPDVLVELETHKTPTGIWRDSRIARGLAKNRNEYPWQDITQYLRYVDIKHGRNSEFDRIETAEATIRLDNRLRTFDPTYVASPYYPNIKPMRRIRVKTRIEYPELIKASGPAGYWKLEETSGPVLDSSGNGNNGTAFGAFTHPSSAVYGGLSSYAGPAGTGYIQIPSSDAFSFRGVFSLECWGYAIGPYLIAKPGAYALNTTFSPFTGTAVGVSIWSGGVSHRASVDIGAVPATENGIWSHFVTVYDGERLLLYANGAPIAETAFASDIDQNSNPLYLFWDGDGGHGKMSGQLSHVVVYERPLYSDEVYNHYRVGIDGYYSNFTGYVENFPQDWPEFYDGQIEITAHDAFAVLSQKDIPYYDYFTHVMADAPLLYYRFGDAVGTAAYKNNNVHNYTGFSEFEGTAYGGYAFGGEGKTDKQDGDTALILTRTQKSYVLSPFNFYNATPQKTPYEFSVELWYKRHINPDGNQRHIFAQKGKRHPNLANIIIENPILTRPAPTSVATGTCRVTGFEAGENVEISLDTITAFPNGTGMMDANGAGDITFTVDTSHKPGFHRVIARGTNNQRLAIGVIHLDTGTGSSVNTGHVAGNRVPVGAVGGTGAATGIPAASAPAAAGLALSPSARAKYAAMTNRVAPIIRGHSDLVSIDSSPFETTPVISAIRDLQSSDRATVSGGKLFISGSGYAPNAAITIRLNDFSGGALLTATADVNGLLQQTEVTIPTNCPAGVNQLIAMSTDVIGYFTFVNLVGGGDGTAEWEFFHEVSDESTLGLRVWDFSTTPATPRLASYRTNLNNNQWYHMAATFDGASIKVYMDGVKVADNTYAGLVPPPIPQAGLSVGIDLITGEMANGYFDELAIYDYDITQAQILDHIEQTLHNFPEETGGPRLERMFDEVKWPADQRQLDTGNSVLMSYKPEKMSAKEYFQKVGETENGTAFIDGDGRVTFYDRHHRLLRNRMISAVFSDVENHPTDLWFQDITTDYDRNQVINHVDITRTGEDEVDTQTVKNEESIQEYFDSSFQRSETLHLDRTDALHQAEHIVTTRSDPFFTITGLELVTGIGMDRRWTIMITSELGTLFRVIIHPMDMGDPISQLVFVENIQHTWDAEQKKWTTRFGFSNADMEQFWILGDPIFSILGVTTIPTY